MIRIIYILFVAVLLTGCTGETAKSQGFSGDIIEYRLSDGTRCVVFVAYQKGGISCDWTK